MAYKLGERTFPSREGEFYANWCPEHPPVAQFESDEVEPDFMKVRVGRPRPAGGNSSEEMADEGWVGLYLKRDLSVPPGAEVIPTPAWMQEPPAPGSNS